MIELFTAGQPVPRSYFKRLDGVKEVTFAHPCIVTVADGQRFFEKARPVLDGPLIHFDPVYPGGVMNVAFAMPSVMVMS